MCYCMSTEVCTSIDFPSTPRNEYRDRANDIIYNRRNAPVKRVLRMLQRRNNHLRVAFNTNDPLNTIVRNDPPNITWPNLI
jgi:ribosomal protein L34E